MYRLSNDRPSDVLGALPRRRPQRRSAKRAAPAPAENSAAATTQTRANGGSKSASPAAKRTSAARSRTARAQTKKTTASPGPRKQAAIASGPTGRSTGATAKVVAAPTRATRRRPERLRQPAQPAGAPPPAPQMARPEPPPTRRVLGTAAQAAAELAEIGLTASARALRNAMARLPRP